MSELHLIVTFPRNRDREGKLEIYEDGFFVDSFPALGRGSRGPRDTSVLKKGNTPTGFYDGELVETEHWDQVKYWPWELSD